jgi:hypothetical protein
MFGLCLTGDPLSALTTRIYCTLLSHTAIIIGLFDLESEDGMVFLNVRNGRPVHVMLHPRTLQSLVAALL